MDKQTILTILKDRFDQNPHRHKNQVFDEMIKWVDDHHLKTIGNMEETGGEPDVIQINDCLYAIDLSKETPKQRISLCYDQQARETRKKFPPISSAIEMAERMGVSLVDVQMYHHIQNIEPLDLKTSSWLLTPMDIRDLGGALFGDRRYNTVFIYHNGAESYYNVRGFRSYLKIKEGL
ncbi:MAG: DUF4256 domain-containing protein [Candidatus Izemoplasmataceae bacterium]